MSGQDLAEALRRQVGARLAQRVEHRPLRGEHLRQIAGHEDHAVFVPRRQRGQQQVDHLDGLPHGGGHPTGILARALDRLELEVAARICPVGRAAGVAQHGHPPRAQHLHHE